MALNVGQQAPEFTLPASDGERIFKVSLGEARASDHVVLAFFPFAFSSICSEEMCEFKDQLEGFNRLNARVFGISVDSPHALNAFSRDQGLNFPLLSDFNKTVSAAYGAFHEQLGDFRGVAKRSAFVVDRGGAVRYAWVSEDPKVTPDLDEIRRCLEDLV